MFLMSPALAGRLLLTPPESEMQYLDAISKKKKKKDRMISVHFQVKSFTITVIQVYAPITNDKKAEVEQLYKDL